MTGSRAGRVWGLVAVEAARRGGRVSAADSCAAAVAAVDVTGGWLTAASDGAAGHLMWITDAVSGQLAEFQLTLGEGPLRAGFAAVQALPMRLRDQVCEEREHRCQTGLAGLQYGLHLVEDPLLAGGTLTVPRAGWLAGAGPGLGGGGGRRDGQGRASARRWPSRDARTRR
jgi:hypothetical protein